MDPVIVWYSLVANHPLTRLFEALGISTKFVAQFAVTGAMIVQNEVFRDA